MSICLILFWKTTRRKQWRIKVLSLLSFDVGKAIRESRQLRQTATVLVAGGELLDVPQTFQVIECKWNLRMK
jgi:hypothetical protein